MQRLHLILSCTARKRRPELTYPRLREVRRGPLPNRVAQWAELISSTARRRAVTDLYAGEYWQEGMRLASRAGTGPDDVSVISAGLGLLMLSDQVPMYGATFTGGHADSVVNLSGHGTHSELRRQWWAELTHANVLDRNSPEQLANIGARGVDTSVMVCVGRHYVEAVATDLVAMAERLGTRDSVIVFTSGVALTGLEDHWVSVESRLRLVLGGSATSTNLRAAMAALEDASRSRLTVDSARQSVARLAATAGELPSFGRSRMSDEEVLGWLVDHLDHEPNSSKTTALRQFRDQGYACEQTRFGRLYGEAEMMTCWRPAEN